MKVLVINWRDMKNPEAGGAEIYVDEILKRKPENWQVDFVSATFKSAAPSEEINGYKVYRIFNNFLFNLTIKSYWKRILSKNKYDLVIDSISKIPVSTPKFIKNVPLIAIHYHIHGKSLFKQLPFPMAFYVYMQEKINLKFYKDTPTMVISESNQSELINTYGFNNLVLAYPGIDFSWVKNAQTNRTPCPTLFCFGRLKKYKRFDHIIRAFEMVRKQIPEAKLFIAGKGDDELRLKDITKELGLEKAVDFLGYISEEKKAQLIQSSWVSAITSEKEGWGIVVIEANAGGLPVIGYNVEGVRNSIKDGASGFLIPNGDISLLADKICLLFSDRSLREKMSHEAIEWSKQFTWDNTAEVFYKFVEKSLSDRN